MSYVDGKGYCLGAKDRHTAKCPGHGSLAAVADCICLGAVPGWSIDGIIQQLRPGCRMVLVITTDT